MSRAVAPLRVGTSTAAGSTCSRLASMLSATRWAGGIRPVRLMPLSSSARGDGPLRLRRGRDLRQHPRRVDGLFPHRGLGREHHAVRAVEYRIRHVAGLRRVGMRLAVMDSSICVAVTTGFARGLRHAHQTLLHEGDPFDRASTPRSPRAIMTPSDASDLVDVVERPRSLDLGDDDGWWPRSAAALRTARKSAALSTNDWLTASTPAPEREREALAVPLGQGADAQVDPRQVEPFAGAHSPPTRTVQSTSLPRPPRPRAGSGRR